MLHRACSDQSQRHCGPDWHRQGQYPVKVTMWHIIYVTCRKKYARIQESATLSKTGSTHQLLRSNPLQEGVASAPNHSDQFQRHCDPDRRVRGRQICRGRRRPRAPTASANSRRTSRSCRTNFQRRRAAEGATTQHSTIGQLWGIHYRLQESGSYRAASQTSGIEQLKELHHRP